MRKRVLCFTATAGLAATLLASHDADACGGCFVPPTESTVVTGHRMAVSISPVQSVLWDQIQYSGNPADFSWVLPVKPGARLELSTDAFFEALETGTSSTVQAPPEGCKPPSGSGNSGFGCGAMSADEVSSVNPRIAEPPGGNGVTVVHEGTVGPYETVTLRSETPSALRDWLTANGYDLPDAIAPVVDAYVNEGFDFIALRLQPGQGVQQMKPVRVVSPGMGATLPLRMVAAGTGAQVAVVLYVVGEGRYQAGNFDNATISADYVTWDFRTDESDYAALRLAALGKSDGRTWLTSYATRGGLLGQVADPLGTRFYDFSDPVSGFGSSASTIAGAYFRQGARNGEDNGDLASLDACIGNVESVPMGVVTDLCDEMGQNCRMRVGEELDARAFACAGLDDLAVALTGLHPQDVTLTRLEAALPTAALDQDLLLQASADQTDVHSRFQAGLKINACWDSEPADSTVPATPRAPKPPLPPEGLILLTLGAAGIYLATRRRWIAAAAR